MGVDADVGNPGQAVGQAFPEYPFPGTVGGNPVDGAVGGIVEPLALFDDPVGGVLPDDEGEDPADLPLLFQDMALPVPDILQQRLPGGPAVSPLARISGLAHLFSRICVYLLYPSVIGEGGVPDGHLSGVLSELLRHLSRYRLYHIRTVLNRGKQREKVPPIPLTLPQGHSIHWRKRTGGAMDRHPGGEGGTVMGVLKKLIGLHRILFLGAALLTVAAAAANLWWNSFLADVLDMLGAPGRPGLSTLLPGILAGGTAILLALAAGDYLSFYAASYTCELFAHEMRMGYARYYLWVDGRMLAGCNAGEEQSAMQNELRDVSAYLNESLFSIMKQFVAFAATAAFLVVKSPRLALLSTLPAVPLMLYCFVSGRAIKTYTARCMECQKRINGLTDVLLSLFPVIQVYGAQRLVMERAQERLAEWGRASVRKERIAARLMSLSGLLSFVPLLCLLGFGGGMVIAGEISTGTFYLFVNLSGNVSGFLQNMPGVYAGFRQFGASMGRLERKMVFEEGRNGAGQNGMV